MNFSKNLGNFMKDNNILIKKLISIINENIDENIKLSNFNFKTKKSNSSKLKILEYKFIKIMIELELNMKKSSNIKKPELISNFNTISTVFDRLSVEKTKLHHFRNNMNNILSKSEIMEKCNLQKKIIKKINYFLQEKILESFNYNLKILKEERTFK